MPLVPFFLCGIVSMSCISFFSQVSALWPLYISSFPLCVNTLFHLLFLFALPALLPSLHIFCSLHQYLLFSHCLQRGILCWSCCLSRAQLGLLPPSLPLVLHLSPPCHYGEDSVGSPLAEAHDPCPEHWLLPELSDQSGFTAQGRKDAAHVPGEREAAAMISKIKTG